MHLRHSERICKNAVLVNMCLALGILEKDSITLNTLEFFIGPKRFLISEDRSALKGLGDPCVSVQIKRSWGKLLLTILNQIQRQ